MGVIAAALAHAELFISIGTSGAVYPAAGFCQAAKAACAVTVELNLEPSQVSHHFDETRHLAFGRARLAETFEEKSRSWTADELTRFREWLIAYLTSSWGDYYNPTMYKDAGLADGYELRQMALEHGREHRRKASEVLVNLFLKCGILEEAPEL